LSFIYLIFFGSFERCLQFVSSSFSAAAAVFQFDKIDASAAVTPHHPALKSCSFGKESIACFVTLRSPEPWWPLRHSCWKSLEQIGLHQGGFVMFRFMVQELLLNFVEKYH